MKSGLGLITLANDISRSADSINDNGVIREVGQNDLYLGVTSTTSYGTEVETGMFVRPTGQTYLDEIQGGITIRPSFR